MGNDNSSSTPSDSQDYKQPSVSNSTNGSFAGDQIPFHMLNGGTSIFDGSFWSMLVSMTYMEDVMNQCNTHTNSMAALGIKIFIMVTGLLANAGLMWLLLHNNRSLSASEVLGLNLSILDLFYCLCLPLDIYTAQWYLSDEAHSVVDAFSALNISGCPLLLTFMCFERYLAAARPVAYMRLGKWEYRAALCACAWVITLTVALLAYFLGVFSMALYLALSTTLMFLLMLLCLGGIVWVLVQSGPGEGSGANVPLKRRALKNIVAVMVPSVVAYTPIVALVPFMVMIQSQNGPVSTTQCRVLQMLLAFPNLGVYIGPLFYLSRVRQLPCWKRKDKRLERTLNSQTQAE